MFKFFSREATPQETDALTAWLEEDSSHEIEFNKAYELFVITQVMAYADVKRAPEKLKSRRWIWTAVSVAADNRVDNRVMYSAGIGAIKLGILPEVTRVCYGIPLNATSKSIYFDRNPGAVLK